jgi:hypothetical protein
VRAAVVATATPWSCVKVGDEVDEELFRIELVRPLLHR